MLGSLHSRGFCKLLRCNRRCEMSVQNEVQDFINNELSDRDKWWRDMIARMNAAHTTHSTNFKLLSDEHDSNKAKQKLSDKISRKLRKSREFSAQPLNDLMQSATQIHDFLDHPNRHLQTNNILNARSSMWGRMRGRNYMNDFEVALKNGQYRRAQSLIKKMKAGRVESFFKSKTVKGRYHLEQIEEGIEQAEALLEQHKTQREELKAVQASIAREEKHTARAIRDLLRSKDMVRLMNMPEFAQASQNDPHLKFLHHLATLAANPSQGGLRAAVAGAFTKGLGNLSFGEILVEVRNNQGANPPFSIDGALDAINQLSRDFEQRKNNAKPAMEVAKKRYKKSKGFLQSLGLVSRLEMSGVNIKGQRKPMIQELQDALQQGVSDNVLDHKLFAAKVRAYKWMGQTPIERMVSIMEDDRFDPGRFNMLASWTYNATPRLRYVMNNYLAAPVAADAGRAVNFVASTTYDYAVKKPAEVIGNAALTAWHKAQQGASALEGVINSSFAVAARGLTRGTQRVANLVTP